MVTYEQIYEAFVEYAASRSQADWNKLWFLTEERMAALVKTKAKGLSVPLDAMDLMDLIRDASTRVLRRLKEADDVTVEFISKTFYNENRTAFEELNRLSGRWRRMAKTASSLNNQFGLDK